MSKKVNASVIEAATTAKEPVKLVLGEDLRVLMEQYPNVSLRKLSNALEVNYGAILKASKAPIPGLPYDPDFTNWDQIVTELVKRNANFLKVDWESLNAESARATVVAKDLGEWNVGDLMYLRKSPTVPYEIVYKTETHMVLQLLGTTEPICWAHGTVLLNGPSRVARTEKVAK